MRKQLEPHTRVALQPRARAESRTARSSGNRRSLEAGSPDFGARIAAVMFDLVAHLVGALALPGVEHRLQLRALVSEGPVKPPLLTPTA
ncbi:hypothetical protein J7I98_40050 [Streptomyces sp. ISL-98]|nr:hypothetical protein [Streptomyces sp. ISL-98]